MIETMFIIIITKLIHIRIIVLASFYPDDEASEPKTETTAEEKMPANSHLSNRRSTNDSIDGKFPLETENVV